jgi:hypothetical protein
MANANRLIYTNSLIMDLRRAEGFTRFDDKMFAIDIVNGQDTVDAVEVVHGRWEDMWSGKYANPRYRCSVCKEKALYKSVRDILGNWKDVQELTPYCPYCMAKLEGVTDNDI